MRTSLARISQNWHNYLYSWEKKYKLTSHESFAIQVQEVSTLLGVPLSCIVPVKNYSEELELDPNCDILLLSAIIQMLRFADNYFDEIGDEFKIIKFKKFN